MARIVSKGLEDVQRRLDNVQRALRCKRQTFRQTRAVASGSVHRCCTRLPRSLLFCHMRNKQKLDSARRASDFTFGEIRKRVGKMVRERERECRNSQCGFVFQLRELCDQVGKDIDEVGKRLLDHFGALKIDGQSMISM